MSVPRMFKEPTTGEAVPSESETMVGERVDFDKIEMSGAAGEEKIFRYVQEPLRKWLANFDTVVVRSSMPKHLSAVSACSAVCPVPALIPPISLLYRELKYQCSADFPATSGAASADPRLTQTHSFHDGRYGSPGLVSLNRA